MIDRATGLPPLQRVTGGSRDRARADRDGRARHAEPARATRRGPSPRRSSSSSTRSAASSTPRRSRAASCIPMLFGSAAWNFGVGLLLDALRDLAPSAPPARDRRRHAAPGRRAVRGARVQGAGQHGPAPPRPRRVRADLLGPLRARDARDSTPAPGRTLALNHAHEVFGQDRAVARRGVPGRRRRRGLRRRRARRRHAAPGRDGALPADPDADAGVLRDDLQPRLGPPQAVPPRARAARPGGRRPRPAARVQPGPGARARRASARCSSRSPSSA